MRRGRPKVELTLTGQERDKLIGGARAAISTRAYALRCKIVLACAEGATNAEVAARLGVSAATVGKWRARFVARRLTGLVDEPRSGRPCTVQPDLIERIVADTLGPPPGGRSRWSRAVMANYSGLSASTIGRIWRQFDLVPRDRDGPCGSIG
jgi:hypothetical protein